MKGITKKQQKIMDLADQGLDAARIAVELGGTEANIKAQLTRIRKKVKAGSYVPKPLPIEGGV